jgi:hypothetical protein
MDLTNLDIREVEGFEVNHSQVSLRFRSGHLVRLITTVITILKLR